MQLNTSIQTNSPAMMPPEDKAAQAESTPRTDAGSAIVTQPPFRMQVPQETTAGFPAQAETEDFTSV